MTAADRAAREPQAAGAVRAAAVRTLQEPDPQRVDAILVAALAEDRGSGDLTSESGVPATARARARLLAKDQGVLAGIGVFARVFRLCDPECRVTLAAGDGEPIAPGQELACIEGNARALLLAERTALNLLQRMSGIATQSARLVRLAGERLRVLDTRKTTPGLRVLEKYAVRCGGAHNHRFGLYDEVLVKENHIALAGRPLDELLRSIRAAVGPTIRITAEARTPEEALAAISGGADVLLLDNMAPAELELLTPRLRASARALGRAVELEASGGIGESNLPAYACCGLDRVSVGALTHSVRSLDLALYLEPLP